MDALTSGKIFHLSLENVRSPPKVDSSTSFGSKESSQSNLQKVTSDQFEHLYRSTPKPAILNNLTYSSGESPWYVPQAYNRYTIQNGLITSPPVVSIEPAKFLMSPPQLPKPSPVVNKPIIQPTISKDSSDIVKQQTISIEPSRSQSAPVRSESRKEAVAPPAVNRSRVGLASSSGGLLGMFASTNTSMPTQSVTSSNSNVNTSRTAATIINNSNSRVSNSNNVDKKRTEAKTKVIVSKDSEPISKSLPAHDQKTSMKKLALVQPRTATPSTKPVTEASTKDNGIIFSPPVRRKNSTPVEPTAIATKPSVTTSTTTPSTALPNKVTTPLIDEMEAIPTVTRSGRRSVAPNRHDPNDGSEQVLRKPREKVIIDKDTEARIAIAVYQVAAKMKQPFDWSAICTLVMDNLNMEIAPGECERIYLDRKQLVESRRQMAMASKTNTDTKKQKTPALKSSDASSKLEAVKEAPKKEIEPNEDTTEENQPKKQRRNFKVLKEMAVAASKAEEPDDLFNSYKYKDDNNDNEELVFKIGTIGNSIKTPSFKGTRRSEQERLLGHYNSNSDDSDDEEDEEANRLATITFEKPIITKIKLRSEVFQHNKNNIGKKHNMSEAAKGRPNANKKPKIDNDDDYYKSSMNPYTKKVEVTRKTHLKGAYYGDKTYSDHESDTEEQNSDYDNDEDGDF